MGGIQSLQWRTEIIPQPRRVSEGATRHRYCTTEEKFPENHARSPWLKGYEHIFKGYDYISGDTGRGQKTLYRIPEWVGLKETSKDHLIPLPAIGRDTFH